MFPSHLKILRGSAGSVSARLVSVRQSLASSTLHTSNTTNNNMHTFSIMKQHMIFSTTKRPANIRMFSSGPLPGDLRAYPQYIIPGETCLLSVKVIVPSFRCTKSGLSLDQKGRILLEFTPRDNSGTYTWTNKLRFGLSVEEAELFCNRLPHHDIELCRHGPDETQDPNFMVSNIERPDKILRVKPEEAGTVRFTIDHVLNGIGGQSPWPLVEGKVGLLEIVVQAGEFEVITCLMQHSLQSIAGIVPLVDIAIQNTLAESLE